MSDSERYHLLRTIVRKSKIRVACPKCHLPFPDIDPLNRHFEEKKDTIHQGLSLRRKDFLAFRQSYEDAVGHEVLPEQLRSTEPVFDVWFLIEQILWRQGKIISDAERYDLLRKIVDLSKVRVACPKCLHPGPRPDILKKFHFQKESDDVHQGLCLRKEEPVTFRASYQQAIGKAIPLDLLASNQPVFSIDFVIDRKLSNETAVVE